MNVFIDALRGNKHLISLNLGNNKIDDSTGGLLKNCLEHNETLIDFEFGFNNIRLDDVSYSKQAHGDAVGS